MLLLAQTLQNPSLPAGYDLVWGAGALVVVAGVVTLVRVLVQRSRRRGER